VLRIIGSVAWVALPITIIRSSIQAYFSSVCTTSSWSIWLKRLRPWLTILPSKRFSSLVIAPTKKQPAQTLPIYELRITLRGSNPAIWRLVQVPGGIQLNRLHDVFQVVMGWTDSHLHQFVDAPIVYSVPSDDDYSRVERLDERRFCLADILRQENAAFIYEYDFGDGWAEVRITLLHAAILLPVILSA
jgi:Plasmid pRiA4b ORF-3-like protein